MMDRFEPPLEFDGYRLVRLVGRGGMGQVHLAHDTFLERDVAIKFVSSAEPDLEDRKRFLVEARAIARLQHPNVVAVYRVGEVAGVPYLVSEFVRGQSLDTLERPVPWREALAMGLGISCGLAAAHRRGVVHRDIKPANVIRGDDGQVKLLDFGIAKVLGQSLEPEPIAAPRPPAPSPQGPDEATARVPFTPDAAPGAAEPHLTHPGTVLGTPSYMAPELWRGEPATFRSDVYALGALLYDLCSGHPPHRGAGLSELRRATLESDAVPLVDAAELVDPAFSAIVARCLARDPAKRFAGGNEVRAALAQLTPEARISTLPAGNPYRGLHAFEAEHSGAYFGRDSEIRTLLERLRTDPFALVTGDSGVGKSSLCRAGVLPRVADWLEKRRAWSSLIVAPGRNPVRALAAGLAPVLGRDEEALAAEMLDDASAVARGLRSALGSGAGLVLFLDQAEELVTVGDPKEAAAAADVLGWLAVPSPGIRLLASVRGDFLSRLATLPRLGEEIPRALYFLRPLSRERLREAIRGPALAKGVTFESDALVEELVESTARAEGGLPLLQFALAELWDAKGEGGSVITAAHLRAIGGVGGALTRHADEVLGRMTPAERAAARKVLLRLVTPGGSRAHRSEAELGDDDPRVHAAIHGLVEGRLLVARNTPDGAGYQIAHEALLSGWTTLARWLADDAGGRVLGERLRLAVVEWERLGRARDALWSPRQLREAGLLDEGELSPREVEFLAASRRASFRRRAAIGALLSVAPAAIALTVGAMGLEARADKRALVGAEVAQAEALRADAARRRDEAHALEGRAYAQFDHLARADGEKTWASALAASAELDPLLGAAGQHLETALLLDPSRGDVRALFADLLYERALHAEERRDVPERDELLRRLRLHDPVGARLREWAAPGTLSVTVSPPGASLVLGRFVPGEHRRKRLEPVELPAGPIAEQALPAGSYLLALTAPGRAPVRFPFVLRRRSRASFAIELPESARVPSGYAYVPPGPFLFGSAAEDRVRQDFFHTVPLHEVTTGGYLVAERETTFEDWIAFLRALPASERAARLPRVGKGGFQGALDLKELAGGTWQLSFQPTTSTYVARWGEPIVYPGRSARAEQDWRRFPVVGISIDDARGYVEWLDRSGKVPGARLCTELEWEKAARGSDGREYPHGDGLEVDDANFDDTYAKAPLGMGPDEVGSHPISKSPFGLDDMAGNVWEWTRSSLAEGEYAARGGSWYFGLNSARTTDREVTEPSFRDVTVGMRVCADLLPR
jgi:formylglycine-generating enzyme required for sulfatase activity